MAELPLEHVSVPPETESDTPAPGLFILHGRGADEQDLLPLARSLPDYYHVVSFRAPSAMGPGYTWYELDLSGGGLHQSQPNAEDFRHSLELLEESVSAAIDVYDLDSDHLGFLGFSQGAIVATAFFLESPQTVAWLAALHGYLPASHQNHEPNDTEGVPVFVAGGADDQVIPASRSDEIATHLEAIGAAVTADTYPGGHGIGAAEQDALVSFVSAQLD